MRYTYIHTYLPTYLHTYIPTYLHNTYIPRYIHAHMHTSLHAYIDTYIHTYIHTHRHDTVYINTCPCICVVHFCASPTYMLFLIVLCTLTLLDILLPWDHYRNTSKHIPIWMTSLKTSIMQRPYCFFICTHFLNLKRSAFKRNGPDLPEALRDLPRHLWDLLAELTKRLLQGSV